MQRHLMLTQQSHRRQNFNNMPYGILSPKHGSHDHNTMKETVHTED